jgi:hypothetical protein
VESLVLPVFVDQRLDALLLDLVDGVDGFALLGFVEEEWMKDLLEFWIGLTTDLDEIDVLPFVRDVLDLGSKSE